MLLSAVLKSAELQLQTLWCIKEELFDDEPLINGTVRHAYVFIIIHTAGKKDQEAKKVFCNVEATLGE